MNEAVLFMKRGGTAINRPLCLLAQGIFFLYGVHPAAKIK
jgi:hypothetical protein